MSELQKLDEASLARDLDEVFERVCKIGHGSYGSVYKAIHKESGRVVAIKQVPVDTELQEIIKEISIMQQCDSQYIVKYFGSYFKDTDLWIVMEYCGAGSVSDIMRIRNKTLTENEISTVLHYTLKGLEYLHLRKKIHRDIKAGNILLNSEGHSKLADFGVAGQLTDTMAKRNTVIGTPFWMSPEVIQEIGYDCAADIWSLGITALELAEGKPPYGDIHPMRAIFMIPTRPPPSFRNPDLWSAEFVEFVSRCLVKDPKQRASAQQLLQHPFVSDAADSGILKSMINDAREIQERKKAQEQLEENSDEDEIIDSGTMVASGEHKNLENKTSHVPADTLQINSDTLLSEVTSGQGTVVIHDSSDEDDIGNELDHDFEDATMKDDNDDGTLRQQDSLRLILNSTAAKKQHGTKQKYRPAFMDHFEFESGLAGTTEDVSLKNAAPSCVSDNTLQANDTTEVSPVRNGQFPEDGAHTGRILNASAHPESHTTSLIVGAQDDVRQQQTTVTGQQPANYDDLTPREFLTVPMQVGDNSGTASSFGGTACTFVHDSTAGSDIATMIAADSLPTSGRDSSVSHANAVPNAAERVPDGLQGYHMTAAGDTGMFQLRAMSVDELKHRLEQLDLDMDLELEELRQRYQCKRQPIIDAIDTKRKRQQNF